MKKWISVCLIIVVAQLFTSCACSEQRQLADKEQSNIDGQDFQIIVSTESISESEEVDYEEIPMIEVDNLEFKTYINSNLDMRQDEELERVDAIKDGVCYRVATKRIDYREDEYEHLRDYFFVKKEKYIFFEVTYPSLNASPTEDRYTHSVCDFDVEYVDVTFDGNEDILIHLGESGGGRVACAYVYNNGMFVYKKSFEKIPNYTVNEEERCIKGWLLDGEYSYGCIATFEDDDFCIKYYAPNWENEEWFEVND
ncbi:MAG: hypothetical protein IK018_00715 [Lachnospiraceae bacterium]|nr:hypothetical protein [Lachnospiraceae bacterium]MBR5992308.1 hypothetical protein [Lachnospiraceae bacterium]